MAILVIDFPPTGPTCFASLRSVLFEEDEWVGGVLSFGGVREAATIGITNHDERCSMVNFDPGSARATTEVLKVIVRVRENKAGVYGTALDAAAWR